MDENGGKWNKKVVSDDIEESLLWKSMFLGRYDQSLGSGGRIVLPSKFSDIIENFYDGQVAANYSFRDPNSKKIIIVPLKILARWILAIREYMKKSEHANLYFNYLSSFLTPKFDDKQGRLVVPQSLRTGRLEKDIVILGQQDYLVIWDRDAYEEQVKLERAKKDETIGFLAETENLDILL